MAISGVNPKCYILALFVRDDGARFLLGDDPYEFKDKQLHFQQNTIANDVVEVQGNDGYLLAGQVRRPGSQTFDGYVCNGTNSKEEVEAKRRAFLQFFRRSHFYKVIYVFPNGTAIQRKQGFLVDDPTVQELYQQYPEYHVALNFEDVNYYTYEEDDQGQEIYAKEAIIKLTGGGATGGLIWDNYGVVWEDPWSDLVSVSGTEIQIDNEAGVRAQIEDLELQGDTYQQTYSGYNLINLVPMTKEQPSFYQQCTIETVADSTLGRNVLHVAGTNSFPSAVYQLPQRLESGKYYVLKFTYRSTMNSTATHPELWFAPNWSGNNWDVLGSITNDHMRPGDGDTASMTPQSTNWKTTCRKFYVDPSRYSSVGTSYSRICFSLGNNSNSAGSEGKEVWLADAEVYEITEDEWNADTYTSKDFEPYVGGIPAPNPDYPQDVQVVTGEQTVTISDGVDSEDFIISLGTIELCKIGEYQDYIYKSGDDWYVHKDIGKYTLTGQEGWRLNAGTRCFYDSGNSYGANGGKVPSDNTILPNILSTVFLEGTYQRIWSNATQDGIAVAVDGTSNPRIRVTGITTLTDFKDMITAKQPEIYYPLATPTDTQITDATLVGQLDALGAMKLFIGENNLAVQATGTNLPAPLSFKYYTTVAMTGAEWEEGGTKGATIVDVDAIDNTYPVWELMGPATNPTLSVLTTNTALTYNGTITASQKLVIDMFNKTATLNGTSVIGNISGDFVYMAPGTNRVAYSADNTDAPDSTIYWQEVVG